MISARCGTKEWLILILLKILVRLLLRKVLRSWLPEIISRELSLGSLVLSPDGLLLERLLEGWFLVMRWLLRSWVWGPGLTPLMTWSRVSDLRCEDWLSGLLWPGRLLRLRIEVLCRSLPSRLEGRCLILVLRDVFGLFLPVAVSLLTELSEVLDLILLNLMILAHFKLHGEVHVV